MELETAATSHVRIVALCTKKFLSLNDGRRESTREKNGKKLLNVWWNVGGDLWIYIFEYLDGLGHEP
jgi:hypothetical protein